MGVKMKEIYLAGGCFWGMEKFLNQVNGIMDTETGYANGLTEHPTYEEVCSKNTGHAETVKVLYDETVISLTFILLLYFQAVDPISVNRQGGDTGTQYRTGIYYTDFNDEPLILTAIKELQKQYAEPIAIEVLPLENYAKAEEYHQDYLEKHPHGYCHIGKDKFLIAKNAIDFGKNK